MTFSFLCCLDKRVGVLFGKFLEILSINSVRLSTPQKSFVISAVKIELGTNSGVLLEIGTLRGKLLEGPYPSMAKDFARFIGTSLVILDHVCS